MCFNGHTVINFGGWAFNVLNNLHEEFLPFHYQHYPKYEFREFDLMNTFDFNLKIDLPDKTVLFLPYRFVTKIVCCYIVDFKKPDFAYIGI